MGHPDGKGCRARMLSLGFRPIGRLAELGQDVLEIFYRRDIV